MRRSASTARARPASAGTCVRQRTKSYVSERQRVFLAARCVPVGPARAHVREGTVDECGGHPQRQLWPARAVLRCKEERKRGRKESLGREGRVPRAHVSGRRVERAQRRLVKLSGRRVGVHVRRAWARPPRHSAVQLAPRRTPLARHRVSHMAGILLRAGKALRTRLGGRGKAGAFARPSDARRCSSSPRSAIGWKRRVRWSSCTTSAASARTGTTSLARWCRQSWSTASVRCAARAAFGGLCAMLRCAVQPVVLPRSRGAAFFTLGALARAARLRRHRILVAPPTRASSAGPRAAVPRVGGDRVHPRRHGAACDLPLPARVGDRGERFLLALRRDARGQRCRHTPRPPSRGAVQRAARASARAEGRRDLRAPRAMGARLHARRALVRAAGAGEGLGARAPSPNGCRQSLSARRPCVYKYRLCASRDRCAPPPASPPPHYA